MNTTRKLLLVGDGGVGKTSWVKTLTGENRNFEKKYIATLGVEVKNFGFFDIWDIAGQEKYSGLQDGYFLNGDCAIIMFDLTSRTSYKNAKSWRRRIMNVCGNIPTLLVGNKSDIIENKKTFKLPHIKISLKNKDNCEIPLQMLSTRSNL